MNFFCYFLAISLILITFAIVLMPIATLRGELARAYIL